MIVSRTNNGERREDVGEWRGGSRDSLTERGKGRGEEEQREGRGEEAEWGSEKLGLWLFYIT